jgi:hypothetical protein
MRMPIGILAGRYENEALAGRNGEPIARRLVVNVGRNTLHESRKARRTPGASGEQP